MQLNLTIDDLCELLSGDWLSPDCIVCLRSLDINRILYITSNVNQLLGHSPDQIYAEPEYLPFPKAVLKEIRANIAKSAVSSTMHINAFSGPKSFLVRSYPLVSNNKISAILQFMTNAIQGIDNRGDDPARLKKYLQMNIDSTSAFKPTKMLTSREKQCGWSLMQGMTAQQTAEKLNLSSRTVEKHLDSLRKKYNCQSKLELIIAFKINESEFG